MEAWRNYGEMAETMEPEHSTEVFMMLLTATQEVEEPNKVPEPTLDKIKG